MRNPFSGKSLLGTNHQCCTPQLNGALAWCSSLTFRFVKAYIGPAASEYFPCFFPQTKLKVLAGGAESSRARRARMTHFDNRERVSNQAGTQHIQTLNV
jgi:hypothetical protein